MNRRTRKTSVARRSCLRLRNGLLRLGRRRLGRQRRVVDRDCRRSDGELGGGPLTQQALVLEQGRARTSRAWRGSGVLMTASRHAGAGLLDGHGRRGWARAPRERAAAHGDPEQDQRSRDAAHHRGQISLALIMGQARPESPGQHLIRVLVGSSSGSRSTVAATRLPNTSIARAVPGLASSVGRYP